MSDKSSSKIDIQVGSISFSAEGEQTWLSEQLEKVLAAANAAGAVRTEAPVSSNSAEPTGEVFRSSLAAHLKLMNAEGKQVLRFLATADWLRRRGTVEISSGAVAKALTDNHQRRLANPADCLNQNVSKGFCEKTGKTFFLTPEGLKSLGYNA